MTREEIIRMARGVGLADSNGVVHAAYQLERFASLVATIEREKVAAWMIERSYATGHGDTTEDLLKELEWQIRESEREACAKVCDVKASDIVSNASDEYREGRSMAATVCAAAIRARSEK